MAEKREGALKSAKTLEAKQYSDRYFANRRDDLASIEARIEQAQKKGSQIKRALVEFYAVKGQGKSWLLHRIFKTFSARSNTKTKYAKPPLSARVDFDDLVKNPALHPQIILKTLIEELLKQSGRKFEIPPLGEDKVIPSGKFGKIIKKFTQFVEGLYADFVPILIFDTTDRAEESVLEWLEEKIVFPLIQSDQIIFVFGGRRRLFWKYFDVRMRVEARELFPLSREGAIEQFALRDQKPEVAEYLYRFSCGHPEINSRVLSGLQYDLGLKEINRAALEDNRVYILDRVREVIDSESLALLGKEAYQQLWDVCVLRWFHTAQLRYFAGLRDSKREKKPEGDFLDLIQQMIDASLVRWDSVRGGYVVDPTVRSVMLENLEERDRAQYSNLQNRALQLYQSWVEKYPDNSAHYLVEIVYHEGMLLQIKEKTPATFLDVFKQILAKPQIPSLALEETALSKLLREDNDVRDLFQQFAGLESQIGALVADAYQNKRAK